MVAGRRGLSLAETLIGMFLLAGGGFACVTLMLRASRIQTQTMVALEGARLAEQCQQQVRVWGQDPARFLTGTLYNDLNLADPAWNGYTVRIRMATTSQAVLSPNTGMESGFAGSRRLLPQTQRNFTVEVRWGTNAQQAVVLASSLGAPVRPVRAVRPVQFTQLSGSASMLAEAVSSFRVALFDNLNQEIPGVTFHWQVLPEFVPSSTAGLGSLDQSLDRSGHQVYFIHHYYAGDPALPNVSGWCRLRAQCRYGGKVYVYDTDPILLQ
jgi:hypothetical protein